MKIDKILDLCYEREAAQIHEEDLHSSPHGSHWSTSFHASDPRDCPRKSVYTLLNVPKPPANRWLTALGEAGKAIEESIVWRFERAGILLSNPPSAEHQTLLSDPELWLTAAPDAIIKMPDGRPHPVEIKSKSHEKIMKMQAGELGYIEDNAIQLFTQLGLLVDEWERTEFVREGRFDNLPGPSDGTILYVSRDSPSETCEFTFEHDPQLWEEEKQKLREWKEIFLGGELPERPKDFMWSKPPCQYCPFKKDICKPDFQENIFDLENSNAIPYIKAIRPEYNYEEQRKAIIERWDT